MAVLSVPSVFEEMLRPTSELDGAPGIARDTVLAWMNSDDVDTLGAVYAFLGEPAQVARVSPALQFDEVFQFMLKYFEFCFINDPKSEWANSRYSAGWDLVGWFTWLWDEKKDQRLSAQVKSMLADLYIQGSHEIQKCIEHATLEHLFERAEIRRFFEDWSRDPCLRAAYKEATLWVEHGGTSPLTEKK